MRRGEKEKENTCTAGVMARGELCLSSPARYIEENGIKPDPHHPKLEGKKRHN
jgi:hypothetical protein